MFEELRLLGGLRRSETEAGGGAVSGVEADESDIEVGFAELFGACLLVRPIFRDGLKLRFVDLAGDKFADRLGWPQKRR